LIDDHHIDMVVMMLINIDIYNVVVKKRIVVESNVERTKSPSRHRSILRCLSIRFSLMEQLTNATEEESFLLDVAIGVQSELSAIWRLHLVRSDIRRDRNRRHVVYAFVIIIIII
jgi:hypothetical protein